MMTRGQTSQGIIIINVKLNLPQDQFLIELSSHLSDVAGGDGTFWHIIQDDTWNSQKSDQDEELQARKKVAEVDRTQHIIKHPNFHNHNTAQAEAYVEKQQWMEQPGWRITG